MERRQSNALHPDIVVRSPGREFRTIAFVEDDGPSGCDLGGGDTDGVDPARLHVLSDAVPGNRLDHQALEGFGVEESVETVWTLALSKLPGDSFDAEHALGEAKEVCGREVEDLVNAHAFPDRDQLVAGGPRFRGRSRRENRRESRRPMSRRRSRNRVRCRFVSEVHRE